MATYSLTPTCKWGYRKFSFVNFLIRGWWLGPFGTFVFWPTLISLSLFFQKVGINLSPWGVTQWCWGCYWVPEDPDKEEESSE